LDGAAATALFQRLGQFRIVHTDFLQPQKSKKREPVPLRRGFKSLSKRV
jgi:hypothetical protein